MTPKVCSEREYSHPGCRSDPSMVFFRETGMSVLNYSESYRQHFKIVPAVSETLRHKHYRLRHEVYCRDLGFEPVNETGLEIDQFDCHSLHCLIQARASGHFVGGARLVLANPRQPNMRLPFENTCAATLDYHLIASKMLNRSKVAEISRLVILGRYRRLNRNFTVTFSDSHLHENAPHLRLPCLPIALYLALLAMAQQAGIETLFLLTERNLASSLEQLGGKLIQVGGPVEHHGTRIPSMLSVSAALRSKNHHVQSLFELIAEEVAIGTSAYRDSAIDDGRHPGTLLQA